MVFLHIGLSIFFMKVFMFIFFAFYIKKCIVLIRKIACSYCPVACSVIKGVFTLGMFGSIKTNHGVVTLLMRLILISMNAAI